MNFGVEFILISKGTIISFQNLNKSNMFRDHTYAYIKRYIRCYESLPLKEGKFSNVSFMLCMCMSLNLEGSGSVIHTDSLLPHNIRMIL